MKRTLRFICIIVKSFSILSTRFSFILYSLFFFFYIVLLVQKTAFGGLSYQSLYFASEFNVLEFVSCIYRSRSIVLRGARNGRHVGEGADNTNTGHTYTWLAYLMSIFGKSSPWPLEGYNSYWKLVYQMQSHIHTTFKLLKKKKNILHTHINDQNQK